MIQLIFKVDVYTLYVHDKQITYTKHIILDAFKLYLWIIYISMNNIIIYEIWNNVLYDPKENKFFTVES